MIEDAPLGIPDAMLSEMVWRDISLDNAERNVATGNPYKELVADLMTRGVQILQ